jgi:3-hydroxybutyryl-CoA dehydrogenase
VAQVSTVAVIGAGVLGRGIACLAALGGYRTIVEDLWPSSLRKAEQEFRTTLSQVTRFGQLDAEDAHAAFGRLEYAGSVDDAARQADLVIEAVPEELESKSEIFILLDKICRPSTILVTTSSETDVTQLANVTYRPEKCVGMRMVPSAQTPRWIEVVRGEQTDEETLAVAHTLAENIMSVRQHGNLSTL